MRIKKILLVLTAITIVSCNGARKNETYRALKDVESYMEERPDSALAALQDIDKAELTSKELEAKHALLLSQALDKNYIDLQSDSIIAPALRYYLRKGKNDEKLEALYYRGIVERNKGNDEDAMHWYARASEYAERAKDKLMAGRLYTTMMITYNRAYDIESSIIMADKAKDCYFDACDTARYISSILNLAPLFIQLNDTTSAREMTGLAKQYQEHMTRKHRLDFYLKQMALANNKSDYTLNDLSEFLGYYNIEHQDVNWLSVAKCYCEWKDFQSAYIALDYYRKYNDPYEISYYWYYGNISESFGLYKEATESYKIYNILSDDSDVRIFKDDTKFIEERYCTQLRTTRLRYMAIIAVLSTCLISFFCFIVSIYLKKVKLDKLKEKKAMEKQMKELEYEKNQFMEMYSAALDEQKRLKRARMDTVLGKNVRSQVDNRLAVLNKFVVANISGMYSKEAYDELSKLLQDRDNFLESTRMSFIIAHPQFLMYLKKFGLSDWEISCCCMYCIGLNGNEISGYLKRKSYYNDSCVIRRKLGLDRKTTIDSFLRKKLKECDNVDLRLK